MSIVAQGARGAALAFVLSVALASPASAANPYQFTCYLNPTTACAGYERHTYDNQLAVADDDEAYVASWFTNPSTGNAVSVVYGWGTAGGAYRWNDDLLLIPYVGNYSSFSNLKVDGSFRY